MSPELGKIIMQNLALYHTKFKNHILTQNDVDSMYAKASNPLATPHVSFYLFSMLADYSLKEKCSNLAYFYISKALTSYNYLENVNMLTEVDKKEFPKLFNEVEKVYLSSTNQTNILVNFDIKNEEDNNNDSDDIFKGLFLDVNMNNNDDDSDENQ